MLISLLASLSLVVPQASAPLLERPVLERPVLERVVVVGASLASGFGADCSFDEALGASLRAPAQAPLGLGDMLFFTSPLALGAQQIERALDVEASLVVGIDFLFWFGYGSMDVKGGAIESESERLELLERGLALLDELECPLVIGDFPDMSAAVGKMLSPAQMPEKSTLPLLSKRVREWAAKRGRTSVLPLAEMVAKLGSADEIQIGRFRFAPGTKLMQSDQLHPTRDGLVLTAQLVGDQLIEAGLVRAEELEREAGPIAAKLRKSGAVPAGSGAGTPR